MALMGAGDDTLGDRLRGALPAGGLVTLDWESDKDWCDLGPGTCILRGFVRPKDL